MPGTGPQRAQRAQHRRTLHAGRTGRDAHGGLPLVAFAGVGRGSRAPMSASSISAASGVPTSMPMSATWTRPLCAGPSPCSRPGLVAAKVTVASARTADPAARPVSASTPEGMSMARTRVPCGQFGHVERAVEAGAVGAVDHQVAGRQGRGQIGGADDGHLGSPQSTVLGPPPGRRPRCSPCRR